MNYDHEPFIHWFLVIVKQSFLDTAKFYEMFFKLTDVRHYHLVNHVAQRQRDITEFLSSPYFKIRLIIFKFVVTPAEFQHDVLAIFKSSNINSLKVTPSEHLTFLIKKQIFPIDLVWTESLVVVSI